MRKHLWCILPIILLTQVVHTLPLQSRTELLQSYNQKIHEFVFATEPIVDDLYNSLPQLKNDFNNYKSLLSELKNDSSNTNLTRKVLNHWFILLNKIKFERKATAEQSPSTFISSMKTADSRLTSIYEKLQSGKEAKEKLKQLKISQLSLKLTDLSRRINITESEKANEILNSMIEWDEINDQELFAQEIVALEETNLEFAIAPKLLIEYSRLLGIHSELVKDKSQLRTILLSYLLEKYLDAFMAANDNQILQKKDESVEFNKRLGMEDPIENTELALVKENSLELHFKKLQESNADERKTDLKIKYLDRRLKELMYSLKLSDTQKSFVLLLYMIDWDDKHDQETFENEAMEAFGEIYPENNFMPKLLVEYMRLRKLHVKLFATGQSYNEVLRTERLADYLESFVVDESLIPENFTDHLYIQRMQKYQFWSQCLVATCSNKSFWNLLSVN